MSRLNLAWFLGIPTLLLVGLIYLQCAPPPDREYQLVRTVVDVLAEVDKSYYRELTPEQKQKLVEDMIGGGLYSLDEHSTYLNESALARFDDDTTGEFGGVGLMLTVDPKDPHLTVDSPMPGTPAYDAGIQPGDILLKIDDTPTANLSVADARKFIIGKPGTSVKMTMLRAGGKEPEVITLVRAKIEQHAVFGFVRNAGDPAAWDYFADRSAGIAMIRLDRFNGKTSKELKAALDQCEREGAKSLILDMRGNPGGLLTEAIEVSDLFLAGGTIVGTRDRYKQGSTHAAKDDKSPYENPRLRPMAVLIDGNSASASEIVAAALQDNGRAILVGQRSYGKGSVQKVFEIPSSKTAVKLTAELWLTPTGRNIHRARDAKETDQWGVLPDEGYEVKLPPEDQRRSALLRRQIEIVSGKPGIAPKREQPLVTKADEQLPAGYKDPVVEKALDYLRKQSSGQGAIAGRGPAM